MPKPPQSEGLFDRETLKFLGELSKHNNREWFLNNKARYESVVQAPAVRFVRAMGPRLARISPHLVADPRPFGGSIFRIYRDTRFSRDKSPYKTHVGIHFAHEAAGKGESFPGFYFHLAPGGSMVASGVWHPAGPALQRIRDAIVASPKVWANEVRRELEIEGESYARVPPGYDKADPHAEDLRRKDFVASLPLADDVVSNPRFADSFERACGRLAPLNAFLARALGVAW